MSMSEDEWKAEREFDRPRCACRGLGYVPIRGAGNPMACEPCGCDDADEEDPEPITAYAARRASSSGPEPGPEGFAPLTPLQET